MRRRVALSFLAIALASILPACSDSDEAEPGTYKATIVRSVDGVAHVTAADIPSAVFGQAYAEAQDHPCDLADQIVKVRSERARYFGPGDEDANVNSDFAWEAIGIDDIARRDWPEVAGELRDIVVAFTAGWNASLQATGVDKLAGWCNGQPWVGQVDPVDLYTYLRSITVLASSGQVTDFLGKATPPEPAGSPGNAPGGTTTPTAAPASFGGSGANSTLASNAWAFGSERTATGRGALLANPHFPWEGALRFWEVHLTVPGQLDIYGAQLIGLPLVGIGFNRHVAWSHTVSDGNRFTVYRLKIAPDSQTSYMYDGQPRPMTSRDATIQVRKEDGTTEPRTRTLWSTHYGPVLDFPGLGWASGTPLAIRDANLGNDEALAQFLGMDRATSMAEFQAVHERYTGIPLFNTIATDENGVAWYADTSATPNLSDEAISAWEAAKESDPIVASAADRHVVVLDGTTSRDEWVEEDGARDPGLVPYSEMPMTERRDYVFNANDSFWLSNVEHPLTGDFSPLHGAQRTEPSIRTRENGAVLDDTSPGGIYGDDGRIDLGEIQAAALLNEAGSARYYKEDVVEACRAADPVDVTERLSEDGEVLLDAATVDISKACDVITAWDGRFDLDSRGAVLWRELWGALAAEVESEPAVPFDPDRPIDTPTGIEPPEPGSPAPGPLAMARAVQVLDKAGLPLDVALGEVQHDGRLKGDDPARLGVPGGFGSEGVTNVIAYSTGNTTLEPIPERKLLAPGTGSEMATDGYWVNFGSSFMMGVEYTDEGPRARTILTYGQTADRESPLFTSQVKRFGTGTWKVAAFTTSEVLRSSTGPAVVVSGSPS